MLFNIFNKKTKIQTPSYCHYFLNLSSDIKSDSKSDLTADNHYEKLFTKKFIIRDDFDSINSIEFLKSKEKVFQQMFLDDTIPENKKENEYERKRSKSEIDKVLKNNNSNNIVTNNKEKAISSKTLIIPDGNVNKFSFVDSK